MSSTIVSPRSWREAEAWAAVKALRAGLHGVQRPSAPVQMTKPDGSRASSPEENAQVFAEHFEQLYGREPSFDPSVLSLLQQRDVATGLDHAPTDDEIRRALARLHNTSPGPSGLPAAVSGNLARR